MIYAWILIVLISVIFILYVIGIIVSLSETLDDITYKIENINKRLKDLE